MRQNILKILLVLLTISALLLGFLYYKERFLGEKVTQQERVTLQTPDQRELLRTNPPTDAKESLDYTNKVSQISKDTSVLNITGCIPQPVSVRLRNTRELTIRNDDSSVHILLLNNKPYPVNAETSTKVTFAFEKGGGVYSYSCDKTPHPVGFLLYSE